MYSGTLFVLLTGIFGGAMAASRKGIPGYELLSQMKILKNLGVSKHPCSGYDEVPLAMLNVFGQEISVLCSGKTVHMYAIIKDVKSGESVNSKIVLNPKGDKLKFGDKSVDPDKEYELKPAKADSGSSHYYYITYQRGGLESMKTILDDLSPLISDFCRTYGSVGFEATTLKVTRDKVMISLNFRCASDEVTLARDKDTLLVDNLERTSLVYKLRNKELKKSTQNSDLSNWVIIQWRSIARDIQKPVIHPDIQEVYLSLELFKNDLKMLWLNTPPYESKKKSFFGKTSSSSNSDANRDKMGSISLDNATILTTERKKKTEQLNKKDFIGIYRSPDNADGPIFFYADGVIYNTQGKPTGEKFSPFDKFFLKGVLKFGSQHKNMVQYVNFEKFKELLQKDVIKGVLEQNGVTAEVVEIRLVYGSTHGISAKFGAKGKTFGFPYLNVLRAYQSGSDNYASRTVYKYALYQESAGFIAEDGDSLDDVFALRLQPIENLERKGNHVVRKGMGGDWSLQVIY